MGTTECTFTSGRDWFRLRACGIIINDGKVLMVRNGFDPFYYSAGGCVEYMGGLPEGLDWLEISQLNNQEMQVYPTFFVTELLNLPLHVKHIVTHESDS